MARILWHRVRWKGTVRELAKGLKRCQFDESIGNGFVVDRVRDDRLEARFIERIAIQRTVVDPFGNESLENRVEYKVGRFSYRKSMPELEMVDFPRHIALFTQRLADAMDFSASFTRVEVDPLAWCSDFQSRSRIEIRVRSLSISGLAVGKGVTAIATLSGDVDVREALAKFVGKKSFNLEKVEFQAADDTKSTVKLGSAGVASIAGSKFSDMTDALRESLARASSE
jgi:hypothetical protein